MKPGKSDSPKPLYAVVKRLLPLSSDFFLSLTGLCLVLFILSHLLMDASILISHSLFNTIAVVLDEYYLAAVGVPLVITGLMVHAVSALYKVLPKLKSRVSLLFQKELGFETNLHYVQIITGLLLALFAGIHVAEMLALGVDNINSITSSAKFYSLYRRIYFTLFMITTVIHTSIGMYRLYAKWIGFGRKQLFRILCAFALVYSLLGVFSIVEYSTASNSAFEIMREINRESPSKDTLQTLLSSLGLASEDPILERVKQSR